MAKWKKASSSPFTARATHSDSGISVSTFRVARLVSKKNMMSKLLSAERDDRFLPPVTIARIFRAGETV